MTIPQTEKSFLQFYLAAKKSNPKVVIKSRYPGVHILKGGGGQLYFRPMYNKKRLGLFPFTEQGERDASECYETYLRNNNIKINDKTRSINS